MKQYMTLSESVFRTDNVIYQIPVGDNGYRFDEKPLEQVLKNIVREKLGDEDAPLAEEQPDCDGCLQCRRSSEADPLHRQ